MSIPYAPGSHFHCDQVINGSHCGREQAEIRWGPTRWAAHGGTQCGTGASALRHLYLPDTLAPRLPRPGPFRGNGSYKNSGQHFRPLTELWARQIKGKTIDPDHPGYGRLGPRLKAVAETAALENGDATGPLANVAKWARIAARGGSAFENGDADPDEHHWIQSFVCEFERARRLSSVALFNHAANWYVGFEIVFGKLRRPASLPTLKLWATSCAWRLLPPR